MERHRWRWRTSRRALRKISAQKVRTTGWRASGGHPRPLPGVPTDPRSLVRWNLVRGERRVSARGRDGKKARNLPTTENQQTRSNAYSLFLDHCVYTCPTGRAKRASASAIEFSSFFAISELSANTRAHLYL